MIDGLDVAFAGIASAGVGNCFAVSIYSTGHSALLCSVCQSPLTFVGEK